MIGPSEFWAGEPSDPPASRVSDADRTAPDHAGRTGKGFAILRIAAAGRQLQEADAERVRLVLESVVRRTDLVQRMRGHELGLLLVETRASCLHVPLGRVRAVLRTLEPDLHLCIGAACIGPGQWRTWHEAWRWAGSLLLAESSAPAAA